MIQEEEECFLAQAASLMDVMKRSFQSEPKSTIFKIKVDMVNLVSHDLIYSQVFCWISVSSSMQLV